MATQPPTNVRPQGLGARLGLTGQVRTPEWDDERIITPSYDVAQNGYLNYEVRLDDEQNLDISSNTNYDLKFNENTSRTFLAGLNWTTAGATSCLYYVIDTAGTQFFVTSWAPPANERITVTPDGAFGSTLGAILPVGLVKYALPAGWTVRFRFTGGGVGDVVDITTLTQIAPIGTALPSM